MGVGCKRSRQWEGWDGAAESGAGGREREQWRYRTWSRHGHGHGYGHGHAHRLRSLSRAPAAAKEPPARDPPRRNTRASSFTIHPVRSGRKSGIVNVNLLIDAIVRQTTVLIAQLATAAGARTPLSHTANQVFADLVRELKEQGLGNKVIADMFGLTLRTYHNKIARLGESTTDRGRSLWEAMLAYVQQRGSVSRSDMLARFRNDEEATVRGVLRDLVDSGMLFKTGRGDLTTYRAATPDEAAVETTDAGERIATFAWIAVYRYGPVTRAALAEHVPAGDDALDAALARLVREHRITSEEEQGRVVYRSSECVIPLNSPAGWEAAVFDHYQAMVTAICTKLRMGKTHAAQGEWIGGSTYSYDVWDDHPLRDEVLGFLQQTRERAVELPRRVQAHNLSHSAPPESTQRVLAYVGQTVLGLEGEGDDE